ncbi:porin family protein [Parabacteroides sp. PF5-9]|uniref:porin family protein n=1 Tax=Parabacteroides sp. PF5-9 TaxID=1742404 RepID=UPI002474C028|nr:porin family protein [Parabacteroides sp. PF5-9]
MTAQTPFQQEIWIGGSLGVNFSSINFVPKVWQGMNMGYTGGLALRWITEKHLGLQAELNYSQQGWKEDFTDNPNYEEYAGSHYERTINYLELPFLTHIYFGKKSFRFYVNLGPKISYAISESTSSLLEGEAANYKNEQHDMPIENKFEWGLCGGPGLELRTGVGSFMLEGRYYYALSDIYGNKKKDEFSKSSGQTLSVRLTYLLPLRK